MRSTFLPYNLPSIGDEEIREVTDALQSGWITTGPRVKKFEESFQKLTGAAYACAADSCTAGMHMALIALGVGPGDEVIVPDMTFCATANVVFHVGAMPVIVDVLRDTYHIDPEAIERAITRKTKAIMPVHYGGQICDMDRILDIAQRHHLKVLEDSAHTIDVQYKGRKVGTIGDVTVFSFYATKNITTAEGGMVTTNNGDLAEKIRILTLHGISKDAWKRYTAEGTWYYEVVEEGFKYNMSDIAGALGIRQLERLPAFMKRRRRLAEYFNRELAPIPGISVPKELPYNKHGWHLYVIEIEEEKAGISRNDFITKMKEMNIGTSVHFIPLHRHPLYRKRLGVNDSQYPTSSEIFNHIVSLPLYPKMTDDDAKDVFHAVRSIVSHAP
jgi:dTDP-4-amino-4,6-dideoxygalactose transaminase